MRITLQQLRESADDMFLAVIVKAVDWENAEKIGASLEGFPEVKTVADILRIAVDQTLEEQGIPLTDENKKSLEEDVKKTITPLLEERYGVALLKQGDNYIDLSQMDKLGQEYRIEVLVPFSKYFNKEEYSFEEDEDGKPYLEAEKEPFEKFEKDYFMK